jgi:alpha-tubulin suppressor-like RCC1 family protein
MSSTNVSGSAAYTALRNGLNADYCGITKEGDVHCWGYNATGQLGNGTTTEKYVPTLVAGGGRKFRDISLGSDSAYGLTWPSN